MAITPDVTTVTVDGITIGLSDTIYNLIQAGEFTVANLQPYMVVGQNTVGDQKYSSLSAAERNYTGGVGGGADTPSWFPAYNTGSKGGVTVEFAAKDSVNLTHAAYGRNFLVHGTLNAGGEPQSICNDNMGASDLRIVTSIDYKKIYYDVEMSPLSYNYGPPNGTATYYATGSLGKVKTADNDVDTGCFVYSIFGDDTDFYCVKDWMFPADDCAQFGWHMSCEQSISGNFDATFSSLGSGFENFAHDKTMFRWIGSQVGGVYGGGDMDWNYGGQPSILNGDIIEICSYSPYAGGCKFIITGLDNALRQLANAGLKFKWNSTWYKPIADGGIVTGYTDDMTEESEWDDIEDVTGNTVPVTPPVPPIPDNPFDVDAEIYGWGGNVVGGMVRYYLLTQTEMDNLVSAMGSSSNWVIDYLNNIVSCFIVPNNGIFFSAPVPTTVKFRVDNNNEWDTGVTCKRISGVVNKSGGTIEIPRCTNSFLDFEPYSDYSVYIPFCGRIPIKGNIVCGREISVTYYPDVPTCSLTAVVTCGGSTVAIAKGQFGSMIPVTSSGADRKTAAAISDVSSIITGLGIGIAGAATGNAGFLIAGGSQLVGGLLNAAKDSVQSYAYSSGSSGDTSFFAAGTRCQYYANYLQLDDVVNTSEFGHTIGYLCKEIGKLSSYHGFTICANPHIHISATSTEKEEIKRLLEEGVILP